ncbi:GDSL esterase/lipase [Prunus yedoensis var. nudiflora]|uniref:GDSL esterase/lipase n=1 Tax=Prunus yedoensis var. nudiflora TaxID=2094558 RepID=A0A314UH60_PRUYE|nr:GDSL esterase/lipase [Prunus yedoensis var. nudiflora]
MFVFGSSLVDNGNNNFFESRAKADYLPYGIDFPNGPSGRFTNGKNVVDLLGDQLKLPSFIPPSKDPSTKGSKIVHGVNHASGSSGYFYNLGSYIGYISESPEAELGCKSSESLPSYLFVVGVGGNDYMFNYFARNSHSLSGEGKSDDRDDDDGGDQNMNGKSDGEKEGRLFKSFSLEAYAWRVYHERLFLKDPLDRYRFN